MDLLNQHDLEKALDTTLNSMKEKTIEMKSCFWDNTNTLFILRKRNQYNK